MRDLPKSLEAQLRAAVGRHGLQAEYDRIRSTARLTFLMRVEPASDSVPLGTSRLGGRPDLGLDETWATNPDDGLLLDFIGQFDLSDLPESNGLLPNRGLLQVFAQQEAAAGNVHEIRFRQDALTQLVRAELPDLDEVDEVFSDEDSEPYGTLVVTEFVPTVSLPDSLYTHHEFDDEAHDAHTALVAELQQLPRQREPASRLLGHPTPWQSAFGEDRELLLQAESYYRDRTCHMSFWNGGCLQLHVASAELATCRFTKSEACVFSM